MPHTLCTHPAFIARRGFTLLELIVVLAIMATVSSIAIIRYSGSLNTYRVTLAAEKIAADLQWARTRARTSSATRDVTFDVASHAYSVSNETLRPGIANAYDVRLSTDPYRVNIASANFGGSNVLTFDAYGGNSASGTVRITAGTAIRDVQITASGSVNIVVR